MMMKAPRKFALAVAAAGVLTLPIMARAQGAADFSGTWTFDQAKSTGKPEPVSLAGGESPQVLGDGRVEGCAFLAALGLPQTPNRADFFKLVIKQSPTEINLLEGGVALKWKLDGTEDSISGLGRAGYPKGKAAWEGSTLVLTTTQDVYVGRAMFAPRTTRDVYSIQGGTLTIDKSETFQGNTETKKLVYTKSQT